MEWQAQSGWRRGVKGCCLGGGGFAPPTQEVGCVVVVGECHDVIVCLLVLTCTVGIVCRLPVGFRWSVKISWRVGLLEEQDGDVVTSLTASGPLSILNAH